MKKLKMVIELTYDEELMYGERRNDREWFFKEILGGDDLILHSNEIGDEIGKVKVILIGRNNL